MLLRLFAVATVLSFASLAQAGTTYTLDLTGPNATATGTITTDGATGVLTSLDILSYNITLSSSSASATISTGEFGVDGSDLTATATGLFYNFSDLVANFLGLGDVGAQNYVCYSGSDSCGGITAPGQEVRVGATDYTNPFSGDLEIAAAPAPVPEPSSLAMLGTGVLGLIGAARRKFRNV
jgi:hypothetical protein